MTSAARRRAARAAAKARWARRAPRERQEHARKLGKLSWSKRTPEQRADLLAKMAAGRARRALNGLRDPILGLPPRVVCLHCHGEVSPGVEPVSHGLHEGCQDAYRAAQGFPPRKSKES